MKLNLSMIILFVRDIEKLKQFYVNLLQLEVLEEIPSEWVLLQAGHCTIGLHQVGQQYLQHNDETSGAESNTKIVFETDENLHSLREELVARNISMREVKTFDNYGYWLCDGEDPEGNVFQLKQKK